MNTMILFAVIAMIFTLLAAMSEGWTKFETARGVLIGGVIGWICGFFIGMFLGMLFGTIEHIPVERVQLVALRTADANVFLWGKSDDGSYQISYRLMTLNRDGSMTPRTIEAREDHIKIVEDAQLKGRGELVISEDRFAHNWKRGWITSEPGARATYEYRVPKGTVRNTFDAR